MPTEPPSMTRGRHAAAARAWLALFAAGLVTALIYWPGLAGGFILGMMESVGLTVLASYGDITYLTIFASLMVFLTFRPQGLMGKPWG